MKRYLLIVLVLCFLMIQASAVNMKVSFQTLDEFSHLQSLTYNSPGYYYTYSYVTPVISSVGGNNYMDTNGYTWCDGSPWGVIMPEDPGEAITKASGTILYSTSYAGGNVTAQFRFYDALKNTMGTVEVPLYPYPPPSRILVKMMGTTAYIFKNGDHQVANSTPFSFNPSYIGFGFGSTYSSCTGGGTTYWDDIIWGDEAETGYVFGQPTTDAYYLRKDMINPASSGFYKADGTLISTWYMPASYSRNSNSADDLIEFVNYGTGAVYAYHHSYANFTEQFNWNVYEALFNSSAPYGLYATTVSGKGYSNVIAYVGYGATVAWGQPSYNLDDPVSITYSINGSYWDTGTYTYKVRIVDIYMDEKFSQTITAPAGTVTTTLDSASYEQGIHYAFVEATKISDGSTIIMAYDAATFYDYISPQGYVLDGETGAVISGAHVNITQGSESYAQYTIASGFYNTTSFHTFLTDYPMTFNVTKSGYDQYTYTFTPLVAKTLEVNFTLLPSSHTYSGNALGGIVFESPYNRPIPYSTVTIRNLTYSEYYTTTSNVAGYYIKNNLSNTGSRLYDVWSSKTGFQNSTIYQKLVVGSV